MASTRRTQPLTRAAWEVKRDTIKQLYIDENKPLKEVRKALEERYQFQVTMNQLQRQVNLWQLVKNRKGDDWAVISRKFRAREARGKVTVVRHNGRILPPDKIRKEVARYGFVSALEQTTKPALPPTPPGFALSTPPPEVDVTLWTHDLPFSTYEAFLASCLQQFDELRINTYLSQSLSGYGNYAAASSQTVSSTMTVQVDGITISVAKMFTDVVRPTMLSLLPSTFTSMVPDTMEESGAAVTSQDHEFFHSAYVKMLVFGVANNFAGLDGFPPKQIWYYLKATSAEQLIRFIHTMPGPFATALAEKLFRCAVEAGDALAVDKLLGDTTISIKVNQQVFSYKGHRYTPVEHSVRMWDLATTKVLVYHGADVNKQYIKPDVKLSTYLGWDSAFPELNIGTGALHSAIARRRSIVEDGVDVGLGSIDDLLLTLLSVATGIYDYTLAYLCQNRDSVVIDWVLGTPRLMEAVANWTDHSLVNELRLFDPRDQKRLPLMALSIHLMRKTGFNFQHYRNHCHRAPIGRNPYPSHCLRCPTMILQNIVACGELELAQQLIDGGFPHSEDILPPVNSFNESYHNQIPSDLLLVPEQISIDDSWTTSSTYTTDSPPHNESDDPDEPLMPAVYRGTVEEVRVLLPGIANANYVTSALAMATKSKNDELIDILLEARPTPEFGLLCAVRAYSTRFAKRIIDRLEISTTTGINILDPTTIYRLCFNLFKKLECGYLLAVYTGNVAIVDCLLKYAQGTDLESFFIDGYDVGISSTERESPWMEPRAVLGSRQQKSDYVSARQACQSLLGRDDPDEPPDGLRQPLAVAAAKRNNRDMINFLVDKGAHVNHKSLNESPMPFKNSRGEIVLHLTPLVVAISTDDIDTAKHLLYLGADPGDPLALLQSVYQQKETRKWLFGEFARRYPRGKVDCATSALHEAIHRKDHSLVAELLGYSQWISFAGNSCSSGHSPLLSAVDIQDTAILTLLAAHGFSFRSRPCSGSYHCRLGNMHHYNPLEYACRKGYVSVVQWLLACGAEPNRPVCCDDGKSALYHAACGGYAGIVELLLQHGADVNFRSGHIISDRTPLEVAAEHGRLDSVKLLINAADGRVGLDQAIQSATENGHIGVQQLLEDQKPPRTSAKQGDGHQAMDPASRGQDGPPDVISEDFMEFATLLGTPGGSVLLAAGRDE